MGASEPAECEDGARWVLEKSATRASGVSIRGEWNNVVGKECNAGIGKSATWTLGLECYVDVGVSPSNKSMKECYVSGGPCGEHKLCDFKTPDARFVV